MPVDLQVRTPPTPWCRRGLCSLVLLLCCLGPTLGLELAAAACHGLEGVDRVPSASRKGGGRHWGGCSAAAGCCCQAGDRPRAGLLPYWSSAAACECLGLRPGTLGIAPGPLAVHLQAQVDGGPPRSQEGRLTATGTGRQVDRLI